MRCRASNGYRPMEVERTFVCHDISPEKIASGSPCGPRLKLVTLRRQRSDDHGVAATRGSRLKANMPGRSSRSKYHVTRHAHPDQRFHQLRVHQLRRTRIPHALGDAGPGLHTGRYQRDEHHHRQADIERPEYGASRRSDQAARSDRPRRQNSIRPMPACRRHRIAWPWRPSCSDLHAVQRSGY